MPELPEVEVTLRGVAPALSGALITDFGIFDPKLREDISPEFAALRDLRVTGLKRRGKYIVVATDRGSVLIHLGMTGNLRVCGAGDPLRKHDRAEIRLGDGRAVRLNDARRFGLFLWFGKDADVFGSKYLARLGPEPLGEGFGGGVLYDAFRRHPKVSVRQALMNGDAVAGIGNIYASEILFACGIDPRTPAGALDRERCDGIARAARAILADSVASGGTTIRDFSGADGRPGYFALKLNVYGREGEKCPRCGGTIRSAVAGGRRAFFCPGCQKS